MYARLVVAAIVPMQPRGERRRATLLDATLRVIARDGAAGASHRAVAAEAGVPLGSTTYYFESREQMLLAALRHAADAEVSRIERRLGELDAGRLDRAGWRRAVVDWALQEVSGERAHLLIARHQLRLEALRSPELRAVYGTWTGASLALVETLLRRAGSSHPEADAAVLVAAIDGVTLNAIVLLKGSRRRALVRAVVGQAMDRLIGA
jgi:TetR/AcrR family transcriptional regulator, regulator of biofilm formation and stress response